MSSNKFETYNPIINELTAESIRCSPESWTFGRLRISCDGVAIHYELKNESSAEKASISDQLRQLCEQLYVTMRHNGDAWAVAIVNFEQKEGSWGFNVQFEYEELTQPASSPTHDSDIEPGRKKPWWKFWH